jgi:O-antigen/teichoic acid export membrane protein
VQGVILIINALNIIQSNQLRKRLNFRKLAVVNIVSQLVGVSVAIVTAWHGWGVWALVAQQIVASSMTSILLWTLNRWLPDVAFSMESFKQLFGFGSFILCSNLINTFCNNVQGLLIGRFFTPAAMGYYTQARKLEEVASHSFSTVVDQVSYPILSKFQSDNAAMQSVLYKLTTALAYVTFPLMLVLILVAEPLITLLYGDKWLPCVPYFQILCVAGIASCLQVTYYYAVASKGESKELFIWTIIKRGAALIVLVAGMYIWKIEGLLWASAIGAWLILFANAYLASKHTGYTLIKQLKDMMPITMLSVIVFYIAYILINSISLNIYIEAIISLVLYLTLYLSLSFKFKIKAFMYLFEIIRNYKKSPQNVF